MFKRIAFMAIAMLVLAGAAQAQLLTTFYDINQGNVPEGTQVRIEGIVVTAVAYNGFYAQELAGGPYSGAWVYTSSAEPPCSSRAVPACPWRPRSSLGPGASTLRWR